MAATITTAGKARIAVRIGTDTIYLAVGTGTSARAVGDTTLDAEITDSGLARATPTVSYTTTTTTNDTVNCAKTWTASGAKTVGEIGMLNASSGGTLYEADVTSPARSLGIGDTFTGTLSIVVA